MRPPSVLPCLVAACVVSALADDPFTKDRNGVIVTVTATATASSTASTSGPTTTTSASAAPTASAANNTFHWTADAIVALAILLGFFFIGIVFIATWQVRRMLARRSDKAGIGEYMKHKRSPSVDTEVTDTDALMMVNQRE